MKSLLLALVSMIFCTCINAQLKVKATCASLYVDILDGKVNGIKPTITIPELEEKLPCFTSADEEQGNSKCGGGVYYKDKDLYFYTKRDYVEIGEKFQGKLSIP